MSKVICIAGESGTGKTTSIRHLDPKTTYIIDSDRKGLSWKGWKSQYSKENKNYIQTSDVSMVGNALSAISEKAGHIKTVIVDTINSIMIDDEMAKMKEKSYDKWADLAASVWNLVSNAHLLRDDLTVVFMAHTQTERDESGYLFTRIKTSGRKLDKIVLESKFTTVLIAKCADGRHYFETKARNSTAKTPLGAFEEFEVENDLRIILEKLEEF